MKDCEEETQYNKIHKNRKEKIFVTDHKYINKIISYINETIKLGEIFARKI